MTEYRSKVQADELTLEPSSSARVFADKAKPFRSRQLGRSIADDKDGPLFRPTGRSTGTPHRMTQQDASRLIQRRAKQARIKTRVGNHSVRATGITDYLNTDRSLSEARQMANHAAIRTTQLYDRRDAASLDPYAKVGI
jgi:site-specific recombinase XerC